MEERNFKSIPRAGPSYAGESRLSASAESCRLYTGPTKIALCEEGAETARRKEGEEEREKEVATATTGNRTDYNDDQRQATRTPIVVMERGRSTRRKTPGRTTRRSIILGSEPDTADEMPVDIVCSAGTSREVSLDRDRSAGVTYAELMGRDWSLNSESEPTAVKRRLRDFGAAADKLAKAKRGRTRTCAGRSSARPGQAGRDTSEEAREGEFEVSLESRAFRKPRETAVDIGPILPGPLDLDLDQMGTDDLKAAAEGNLKEILDLTGRSTNLKGGYSNKIRRSAGVLKVVLDTLATRTEAEEVRRLKADNGRLSREVANLKEEVRAYKRDFEEARKEVAEGRKTASPMSNEQLGILESNIARLVGNLVDGRLAALEDRLPHPPPVIRPPLRADSNRVAKAARAAVAASRTSSKRVSTEGVRSSMPPPHKDAPTVKATQKPQAVEEFPPLPVRPALRSAPASKGKGPKAPKGHRQNAVGFAQPETVEAPPENTWSTVVRRKAPNKKAAPQKKGVPLKNGVPKLKLPSSSAVIVRLRPEAQECGLTYGEALTRAQLKIGDVRELGIGPLRIKCSATGSRLIEVPGRANEEKADVLANKLKEALADVAEVVRPVKMTDFKLTGLDDTATQARVREAVASAGGCSPDRVMVGEIKRGPYGSGFALVSCPVQAGQKLMQLGYLVVGWSRVRLQHVGARPRHCYKCLGLGHAAALCPSEKDRSGLCYRCGQPGHKAFGCQAELRCAICSEAGLKAEHKMGGRACNPPPIRGKVSNSASLPPHPVGEGAMVPVAEMSE